LKLAIGLGKGGGTDDFPVPGVVPPVHSVWHATQAAAGALGLRLHSQEVRGPQDLEGAFFTAQAHPDALLGMHREQIAAFATQQHLPSVFASRESVVAGGLMIEGRKRSRSQRLASRVT
jgi:hypothetical protein